MLRPIRLRFSVSPPLSQDADASVVVRSFVIRFEAYEYEDSKRGTMVASQEIVVAQELLDRTLKDAADKFERIIRAHAPSWGYRVVNTLDEARKA